MRTVEESWQSFSRLIPKEAPEIQRQEMQRSFYGGFASCLGLLQSIGEANVSEDAGAVILEGLREELLQFVARLGAST